MGFILKKIGFRERWVKRCVMCARFSVLVNGSAGSKFFMERGLRQGCHLPPFRFNLVAKTLLILVNQFEDKRWLQGIRIQGVPERTTIFQYVDDAILFLRHSEDLDVKLHHCLVIFSMMSGLFINLHKSCLVGVRVDSGATTQFIVRLSN